MAVSGKNLLARDRNKACAVRGRAGTLALRQAHLVPRIRSTRNATKWPSMNQSTLPAPLLMSARGGVGRPSGDHNRRRARSGLDGCGRGTRHGRNGAGRGSHTAQAEGKPEVQPDEVRDDLGRKSVALVAGARCLFFHARSIAEPAPPRRSVSLTVPRPEPAAEGVPHASDDCDQPLADQPMNFIRVLLPHSALQPAWHSPTVHAGF